MHSFIDGFLAQTLRCFQNFLLVKNFYILTTIRMEVRNAWFIIQPSTCPTYWNIEINPFRLKTFRKYRLIFNQNKALPVRYNEKRKNINFYVFFCKSSCFKLWRMFEEGLWVIRLVFVDNKKLQYLFEIWSILHNIWDIFRNSFFLLNFQRSTILNLALSLK